MRRAGGWPAGGERQFDYRAQRSLAQEVRTDLRPCRAGGGRRRQQQDGLAARLQVRERVQRPGQLQFGPVGWEQGAAEHGIRLDAGKGVRAQRLARGDLGALGFAGQQAGLGERDRFSACVLGENPPRSLGERRGEQFAGAARRVEHGGALADRGETDHELGDPGGGDVTARRHGVPVDQIAEYRDSAGLIDRALCRPRQAGGQLVFRGLPVGVRRDGHRYGGDDPAQGSTARGMAHLPPE